MSRISVQNLTFSYDGGIKNVFENVSFNIDTDWKLGFVGRNGRGKTTFLNLLLGKYPYRGEISANVKFTYFPFTVTDKSLTTIEILKDICPEAEDWQILRELSLLKTDDEILYKPFANLSGGEQTKALLAALFLNDGNFLLIDEPTNHLDELSRKTVSAYLRRKKGFILVSHDRAFLDGCIDHVMSLNKTDVEIRGGNFSDWLRQQEARTAAEEAQNDRLKRDIAKLSASAEKTAVWADKTEASKYGKAKSGLKQDKGYVGHKAAKLMKRAKAVEERQFAAIEEKSKLLLNAETSGQLKLSPLVYRAERLAEFKEVEIVYGGKPVCAPVSLTVKRGERIALCGANGCGKSSILKLLVGENIPHNGIFTLSSGVVVSYIPQKLTLECETLSEFAKQHSVEEPIFRAVLTKMGFDKKDFQEKPSAYSEGQKKKVFLAKSLCEKAHLYIWDEPLNFLDVYARMQIEKILTQYSPTMIFVEHDLSFRNAVATETVEM